MSPEFNNRVIDESNGYLLADEDDHLLAVIQSTSTGFIAAVKRAIESNTETEHDIQSVLTNLSYGYDIVTLSETGEECKFSLSLIGIFK